MNELSKVVFGAMAGAVIGWGGQALALVGRVDAIEKSLQRIESRLDSIKGAQSANTARIIDEVKKP